MRTQTGISDEITELYLLSFRLGLAFAHIEQSLSHGTFKSIFKIEQNILCITLVHVECRQDSIYLSILYRISQFK